MRECQCWSLGYYTSNVLALLCTDTHDRRLAISNGRGTKYEVEVGGEAVTTQIMRRAGNASS